MTEKDKKILEDAKRDNIPVFILTAKDALSVAALLAYRDFCASEQEADLNHIEGVKERIYEFEDWQALHPEKVKLPD